MREVRVAYEADLPARSGLGTSSSFAVGMLNAFHCMKGTYASKERLAKEAIRLERELCAEAGGWQDQVAAAYGGLNRIDFADGSFAVRPVVMPNERKRELEASLMLFCTSAGGVPAPWEGSSSARAAAGSCSSTPSPTRAIRCARPWTACSISHSRSKRTALRSSTAMQETTI